MPGEAACLPGRPFVNASAGGDDRLLVRSAASAS